MGMPFDKIVFARCHGIHDIGGTPRLQGDGYRRAGGSWRGWVRGWRFQVSGWHGRVARVFLLTGLLLPGVLLYSLRADAHPHAWIDLDITLVVEDALLVALEQTWIMDPLYSQYLYEDARAHFPGANDQEKLQNLGNEILENLREYDWYTLLYAGSMRVLGQPDSHGARLTLENQQLHFQFRLELAHPVDLQQAPVEYQIYDPTYFIEVLHSSTRPPRFSSPAQPCRIEILRPRPDPAVVAQAMALDFNATGDPQLGRHFAERILLDCPA